jgi:hypothetical protein
LVGQLDAEPRDEALADRLKFRAMMRQSNYRERNKRPFENLIVPVDRDQVDELLDATQRA